MEFEGYLEALASAEPTPGGGSAATLVGALAAALCAMVARITLASAKHTTVHAAAGAIATEADTLRQRLLELRPADEAAFGAVVAAQALPRATEADKAHRTERLQHALAGAAEAPLAAADLAAQTFELVLRTAELENAHLMSDVACALHFARAAFDACGANIAVNHHFIKDAAVIAAQQRRLDALALRARSAEQRAQPIVERALSR